MENVHKSIIQLKTIKINSKIMFKCFNRIDSTKHKKKKKKKKKLAICMPMNAKQRTDQMKSLKFHVHNKY